MYCHTQHFPWVLGNQMLEPHAGTGTLAISPAHVSLSPPHKEGSEGLAYGDELAEQGTLLTVSRSRHSVEQMLLS